MSIESAWSFDQKLSKKEILDSNIRYLNPHRTKTFREFGVELIIGKREGYQIWDIDGKSFFDLHLNGGTYNLGHRHPFLITKLKEALDYLDVGNHHFSSPFRGSLAKSLVELTPGSHYVSFSSTGSEAIDIAIKAARYATKRKKVLSIEYGYHGRSGFSGSVGDDSSAKYFYSNDSENFLKVPFNDLGAIESAFNENEIACIIIETIPATFGFVSPHESYLSSISELCKKFNVLYIADEVQTGLGRTGYFWAIEKYKVIPDILVTSKGLGAGLYPIAATIMNIEAGSWLEEDGWAHVSTFGGSELGCLLAHEVINLTILKSTTTNISKLITIFETGLQSLSKLYNFLAKIDQNGLVIGLKFDHPKGGILMMQSLYKSGIWAIFAGFDHSVLQFKPGLLLTEKDAYEILNRLENALIEYKKKEH